MIFEDKLFHSQKEVGDALNIYTLTHILKDLFKKNVKIKSNNTF